MKHGQHITIDKSPSILFGVRSKSAENGEIPFMLMQHVKSSKKVQYIV